ncbi:hypothetical protein CONLIGDRAFT_687553 [Coniochaeta ligniaria NRRL 30616]|uniref:Uncharacterized protein n=1 Tax=Coniochaeta ligniaria NRRL 30616 TaxID=1408157 RepID=A0A1J7I4P9_9PEZI|nr:hypothetical protein CONLIGDRAFT_687553 [Coniochaeta ligniaria NRRL 30616]
MGKGGPTGVAVYLSTNYRKPGHDFKFPSFILEHRDKDEIVHMSSGWPEVGYVLMLMLAPWFGAGEQRAHLRRHHARENIHPAVWKRVKNSRLAPDTFRQRGNEDIIQAFATRNGLDLGVPSDRQQAIFCRRPVDGCPGLERLLFGDMAAVVPAPHVPAGFDVTLQDRSVSQTLLLSGDERDREDEGSPGNGTTESRRAMKTCATPVRCFGGRSEWEAEPEFARSKFPAGLSFLSPGPHQVSQPTLAAHTSHCLRSSGTGMASEQPTSCITLVVTIEKPSEKVLGKRDVECQSGEGSESQSNAERTSGGAHFAGLSERDIGMLDD